MSYLFIKNLFQREKFVYFHRKIKNEKTKKNILMGFSGVFLGGFWFFGWVFWVGFWVGFLGFLGGFFGFFRWFFWVGFYCQPWTCRVPHTLPDEIGQAPEYRYGAQRVDVKCVSSPCNLLSVSFFPSIAEP
jgi:hypothetical protein